jgi:hypothetical protein
VSEKLTVVCSVIAGGVHWWCKRGRHPTFSFSARDAAGKLFLATGALTETAVDAVVAKLLPRAGYVNGHGCDGRDSIAFQFTALSLGAFVSGKNCQCLSGRDQLLCAWCVRVCKTQPMKPLFSVLL